MRPPRQTKTGPTVNARAFSGAILRGSPPENGAGMLAAAGAWLMSNRLGIRTRHDASLRIFPLHCTLTLHSHARLCYNFARLQMPRIYRLLQEPRPMDSTAHDALSQRRHSTNSHFGAPPPLLF